MPVFYLSYLPRIDSLHLFFEFKVVVIIFISVRTLVIIIIVAIIVVIVPVSLKCKFLFDILNLSIIELLNLASRLAAVICIDEYFDILKSKLKPIDKNAPTGIVFFHRLSVK